MQLTWNNFSFSIAIIFTVLILNFKSIYSSKGDDQQVFIDCVKSCTDKNVDASVKCELDWVLRVSGWNCEADCKYRCMRIEVDKIEIMNKIKKQNNLLNDNDSNEKLEIVQYYGKWPFIRVFGAQEIFSVIFSLGNFVACLYGYFYIYRPVRKQIKRKRSDQRNRILWMDRMHMISLWITCNTWIQSAIFHYRDTSFTEKLDYFSACLFILSTLPVALIRIFRVANFKDQIKLIAPVAVLYLQHVAYMSFVDFDYGYNVKFNATFGIMSNSVWLYWALQQMRSKNGINNKKIGWQLFKFVVMNILSMSMVTIDFPPFFNLIDVHALWHLSTIPITISWYKFITLDLENENELNEFK